MTNSSTSRKYSYDKYFRNLGILIIKIILLLSLAVGSTFAIFTSRDEDTVRISAAEMGMRLYRTTEEKPGEFSDFIEITGAEGDAFAGIEWEPGATRFIFFKVENGGTVPVKYVLRFVADMGELFGAFEYAVYKFDDSTAAFSDPNSEFASIKDTDWDLFSQTYGRKLFENNLSDIDYYDPLKNMAAANRISGSSPVYLEVDGTDYFVVAVHMKEGAGNEFQKKSCEIFIKLYAEQGNL